MTTLKTVNALVCSVALLTGVACQQPASETADHGEAHAVHWGYAGDGAPEHWSHINAEYAVCGEGHEQSPIDLPGFQGLTGAPTLAFAIEPTPLRLVNNGHTVMLENSASSTVGIGEKSYRLLQAHLHAPSEHTVAGKSFPMELHMVHQDEAGELAVVGVLFEVGEANAVLAPIFEHLPASVSDEATATDGVSVNLEPLATGASVYAHYEGSLTTPPCSEGVQWYVLAPTATISEEQLASFSQLMGVATNRPVQAMGERTVSGHTP